MVSAPIKPKGFPIAIAISPGRSCKESPAETAGSPLAAMRRAARSWRGLRRATCAGIERPTQSSARTSGLRATCALVTMSPSLAQITPEPQLRPPAWIRTVERRNRSAISPIPAVGTLAPFPPALADGDRWLAHGPAANDLRGNPFADGFAVKMGLHIFDARYRLVIESDENIANHNAGFVRRPFRFHL